jgi:very-short-patch-repair endonuclease
MANIVDFLFKNKIRTVDIDNETWWVAKDICDLLSLRNMHSSISLLSNNYKNICNIETKKGCQKSVVINNLGICQLVNNSRKLSTKEKSNLFEILGIHNFSIGTKETNFFCDLKEVLDNMSIKIELQKQCLGYRIDGYLPKYKLAIEFDEKHHANQITQDLQRQKEIEKELGCKFIRLKEQNSNLTNIGLILKQIL